MDTLGNTLLQILGGFLAGGSVVALLRLFFDWRTTKNRYRQAIEQKMIDRIGDLAERHYMHVSCSAARLKDFLKQCTAAEGSEPGLDRYRRGILYNLAIYLYYVDRLAKERPLPLLKEPEAEEKYAEEIAEVYEAIPYGFYEISVLVRHVRTEDGIHPPDRFVDLIDQDSSLNSLFKELCDWLDTCQCDRSEQASCFVHQAIKAFEQIAEILVGQMRKIYSEWYTKR